jgi:transcriptional regulator with XRE-family HTH domain
VDTLSSLLKRYRKRSGLTQKELSARINFHHTVISRAEKPYSGYIPTLAFLEQFCAALSLTADEVVQVKLAYDCAMHQRVLAQNEVPAAEPPAPESAADVQAAPRGAFFADPRRRMLAFAASLSLSIWLVLPPLLPYLQHAFAQLQFALVPVETVLYLENFEGYPDTGVVSPDDWEYLNFGKWEVRSVDGNNVFGVFDPDPKIIPNAFLSRSLAWKNYSVSADVVFQEDTYEQIYFVVRNVGKKDNCTGYRVGGNRQGVSIFRFDSEGRCHGELLAEQPIFPLVSGRVYHMRIEAVDDHIRLYINNDLVLEAQDDRYPTGGIGLLAYEVAWAWFDNFRVEKQ